MDLIGLVSGTLSTSGLTAGGPSNGLAGRAWRAGALHERKKGGKEKLEVPDRERASFLKERADERH